MRGLAAGDSRPGLEERAAAAAGPPPSGGARAALQRVEPVLNVRQSLLLQARRRLQVGMIVATIVVLVIGGRLLELAVLHPLARATPRDALAALVPERADIVDRNGEIIAATRMAPTLVVRPRNLVNDPRVLAPRITAIFPDLDQREVLIKLRPKERGTRYLRRRISRDQRAAVMRLGEPGLEFVPEPQRLYPLGAGTPHVVGYADSEGAGRSGIESRFDARLRADRAKPLVLTLDTRVQHALDYELAAGVAEQQAIGGAGVVLDVDTGEVLAVASAPSLDPNAPGRAPEANQRNRAVSDVFELGSVFKIFTVAHGLDSGQVQLNSQWDATRPLQIGRFKIHDDHPKRRVLTTTEAFIYSSNIATSRIADLLGTDAIRANLQNFGFFNKLDLETTGVAEPLLPRRWGRIETLTVSYGHGLSVTPMHVAAAMASVVNGGVYHVPTLIRRNGPPDPGRRVISAQTSYAMRQLLRLAVLQGTGKRANVPGLRTGGKTGTAEKPGLHGYREKAVVATFAGAFPMDRPRYVIVITLDEPKGTEDEGNVIGAGRVAAPVFERVAARIGPILGVDLSSESDIDIEALKPLVAEMRGSQPAPHLPPPVLSAVAAPASPGREQATMVAVADRAGPASAARRTPEIALVAPDRATPRVTLKPVDPVAAEVERLFAQKAKQ